MKPMCTALVGFGKAGEWLHAPFIDALPSFHFQTILERSGVRAAALYPEVQVVKSIEEVLHDPSVELVVIATPNTTHASLTEQALNAGKHVVVDKPFTVTSAEARHLASVSERTGKKVFVYQNRRWDGDFLTVQKLLASGMLGTIESIESSFDRYRPEPRTSYWKESNVPGNGLWYDLGPHLMDQAFNLFGKPHYTNAMIEIQRSGATAIDHFDVLFQYGSFHYRIHAGMMEKKPKPRWLIKGSKASYVKFGIDPQEACLSAGEKPIGDAWGAEPQEAYGHILYQDGTTQVYPTEKGDWRNFYLCVYDSIRKESPFPITLKSSVELIEYIEKLAG